MECLMVANTTAKVESAMIGTTSTSSAGSSTQGCHMKLLSFFPDFLPFLANHMKLKEFSRKCRQEFLENA